MKEELTKAIDSLYFAQEELRKALSESDPVEFIVIMGILESVTTAKNMASDLFSAIEAKREEEQCQK